MYVGCTVLYCIVLHCIIISLKNFQNKKKKNYNNRLSQNFTKVCLKDKRTATKDDIS